MKKINYHLLIRLKVDCLSNHIDDNGLYEELYSDQVEGLWQRGVLAASQFPSAVERPKSRDSLPVPLLCSASQL